MTLENVITLAMDSSLNTFIAENMFLADYWAYRNYKANKLPSLDMSITPGDFNRSVSEQYNFQDSSYQYIDVQNLNSKASISLNQNITATGGSIYLDSDLGRLEKLNNENSEQFSATWFRIGFRQQLFGFNTYKWQSKIEPLKFEKAKKDFVSEMENVALEAVSSFFDLAKAQINLEIAGNRRANADTLYNIGKKRIDLGSISLEDLYTLKLELINATNNYKQAQTNLNRAGMELNSLLRLDGDVDIELILPYDVPELEIHPMEALEQARKNNPELLDYKAQILESQRDVERAKKESKLNANLNASIGVNQSGSELSEAYTDPLDQQIVGLTLSIPIMDWGLAKGQYNIARRNMEMREAQIEQKRIDFDQNILLTAEEFNLQHGLIQGAEQADSVSQVAYEMAKKRFLKGNIDLTKLNAIQTSSIRAQQDYISALERFWDMYFNVRKLTLYDFERNQSLMENFDEMMNIDNLNLE